MKSISIRSAFPVLIVPEDEGVSLHFEVGSDLHDHEGLIAAFHGAAGDLWKLYPAIRPDAADPDSSCRECKESRSRHLTRGKRVLECPDRCPCCNDQAVFSTRTDDGALWAMDVMVEARKEERIVDFCPFCGIDLRGPWFTGVVPGT